MLRLCCLFLTAGLTALAPAAVSACDSTACAAAMRYSDGSLGSGQWRVDVSARHVDQSRRFYGSQSIGQVYRPRVDLAGGGFEAASHQELGASMTFMQLELSRGITESLSAYVSLPLYRSTTIDTVHVQAPVVGDAPALPPGHEHTGDPVGTAISVQNRGSGIGDLQVGLRHALWSSGPRQMTAGFTLKLPTGSTTVAGSDGIVDPMLQPGTGAADFVGVLQYTQKVGGTGLSLTGSFQKAMTSDAGYRYGDDVVVAVGAGRALSPKVTVQVQAKGQRSGRHHFRDSGVPSTGLTLVQVAPGARYRLRADMSLYATMQIPAYVRVNESQLGPRATLTAGFVKAF
jgi:hypothetical protein